MFDYYNMQVALVVPFPLISPNVLRSYHRMMPIKTEFYSELRFLCLVLFLSVWVFLIIFFIFLAIKFILFDNNLSSINNRKIFLVILRRFQACSRKKKMKKILWSCRYAEYFPGWYCWSFEEFIFVVATRFWAINYFGS